MKNDFSVLMAVYGKDDAAFLEESLQSIFSQTIRPAEVILVEDGPLTEELYAVIKKSSDAYPEMKVVALPENKGLGTALNEGLKYCSYSIVARMDSDDICKPNRFERQLNVMLEHPEYDLVGSWIDEFIVKPGDTKSIRRVPETPSEIYRYSKKRCPVNHPTVMYKKESVLKAGGYLTKYFPEDYFLWMRMLMNGCQFYNIQESLLYFRFSPETFKRRGGWKYAVDEWHVQHQFYKMGYLGLGQYLYNVAIRFTTRIMPNSLRSFIYCKMLRK